MPRRSERKKTPDVSASPAPARRSTRRSRQNTSVSPEKNLKDDKSQEKESEEEIILKKSTKSTSVERASPVKSREDYLSKIIEENGDENVPETSSIETDIVDEKTSDKLEEKQCDDDTRSKVRDSDKNIDEKSRCSEIESQEEIQQPENNSGEFREKSPQKEKDNDSIGDHSNVDNNEQLNGKEGTTILSPSRPQHVDDIEEKDDNKSKGKLTRKRKWVTKHSSENKIMAISTDSLKDLISDPVHPVPLSDVHLDSSPEVEITQSEKNCEEEESIKNRDEPLEESVKISRSVSKEELEEGEEESEVEEGQIDRGETVPEKSESSCILYITNLVRPFTLFQLRSMLSRTGKIVEDGFWMDRIKSKCFVKFETEDEAVETRHALHGVRWPASNPKCLNVEFSDENVMQIAVASTIEDMSKSNSDASKENTVVGVGWNGRHFEEEKKSVRTVREWDVGKREELSKISRRSKERNRDNSTDNDKRNPFKHESQKEDYLAKDRKRRSDSYEKHTQQSRKFSPVRKVKREDPPLRLLDDLFRKTKATPCVYWLPLTPEQIIEKEQRRLKRIQEVENQRKEREKREQEREKQREQEREQQQQRRRERERSSGKDRKRDRSRDDRRRSRSRDRRRY